MFKYQTDKARFKFYFKSEKDESEFRIFNLLFLLDISTDDGIDDISNRLLKYNGDYDAISKDKRVKVLRKYDFVDWENFIVYKNSKTIDKYIIVFKHIEPRIWNSQITYYPCVIASGDFNSLQGIFQSGECELGKHLGEKINWDDLSIELRDKIYRYLESD